MKFLNILQKNPLKREVAAMGKKNTGKIKWLRNMFFVPFLVMGVLSYGGAVWAAKAIDYSSMPPFLATEIPPNVLIMLDNSGSMKVPLYNSGYRCNSVGTDFDSTRTYYGMFDSTKTYTYDTTIPVNLNGYNGFPYDVAVDTTSTGAFVEGSCTTGLGVNCWEGNFLNWLVTRRIDAARKVLVGGKVESRDGYDYKGGDGGDFEWKIVANNERLDRTICKRDADGQDYSPFPDNTDFTVSSPANDGGTFATYDPYAKLSGGGSDFNLALIVEEEPTGLLHEVIDNVRLGISFYKYEKDSDIYQGEANHGGTLVLNLPLNPFIRNPDATTGYRQINTPVKSSIDDVVDGVEHYPLVWGTTPLAENYYEIIRYFKQIAPYYDITINPDIPDSSYQLNNTWDPYYFLDPNGDGDISDAKKIECVPSSILVFTDGEPYRDNYVPQNTDGINIINFDGDGRSDDCFVNDDNDVRECDDTLDDLAKWAYCATAGVGSACPGNNRDLRSDMPNEDNYLTTYTVAFGASSIPTILQDTADNGGGIAYLAEDGTQLESQLLSFFDQVLGRSSGTAASVISNTRSGEGAIYQSVFFPKLSNTTYSVNWIGQIHALLVDSYGNMRENTNNGIADNTTLDLEEDYFVVFNEDGTANRYEDGDSNQQLEIDFPTCPNDGVNCYDSLVDAVGLDDLKYLWNTSEWLNEISDSAVETQRSSYISNFDARYIFTWVDGDQDLLVDSSEILPFSVPSVAPTAADLTDDDEIYPYLHLFPSFADRPAVISALGAGDLASFLLVQTQRQINYIRGSDCVNSSDPEDCNTQSLTIGGNSIPDTEMRSRQYDYDGDGDLNTWRLGDIIYSTPTMVGRPAENFHLLYRDTSYAPFVYKYKNRRQVIYAGANDGMVHAFNAGFYDFYNKQFCKSSDFTNCADATQPDLGAELWAYVPFNLLPHLYWLTQPSYDETKHVYYVDQKPRIFDAKIFEEETECSTLGVADSACIHPNGWGTVMVVGMNLGGGSIIADMDKTDGNAPVVTDPTMKSAFLIFDITNPENPPTLMSELTMPQMGFATNYPTVIAMKDGDGDKVFEDYASGENKWYLAFGSGPADANGDPGTVISGTGDYNDEILDDVKSLQPNQFYLLDLVRLASNNQLYTLNDSGVLTAGLNRYVENDTNSFVSPPVTIDWDLDFNADVLYFGTVSGTVGNWAGKLRRITLEDDNDSTNWDSDSVLIDAQKPITAAPAIGVDEQGRGWVYFGTGRYLSDDDTLDLNTQQYFGIKEPLDSISELKDYSELPFITTPSILMDVTDYDVYTPSGNVDTDGDGTAETSFAALISDQLNNYNGWYLDFSSLTGERNLGQAALLGDLLLFTTYTPEADICSVGGSSDLWALYYKTGTAYFSGILGKDLSDIAYPKIDIGPGLAITPNIHVGREDGSAAFIQSSTGEITKLQISNPGSTKSGIESWEQKEN